MSCFFTRQVHIYTFVLFAYILKFISMFTFLAVLVLMVACLMIPVVLVQHTKQEGLGNAYGLPSGANQLIGVQKTSDLLEQITWGLVFVLFFLSFATSAFLSKDSRSNISYSSPNIGRIQEQSIAPEDASYQGSSDVLPHSVVEDESS